MPEDLEPKSPGTSGNALAAVNRVLDLLGRKTEAGTVDRSVAVVPSARVRPALEVFAQAATIEELDAARVDLRSLARDLFDWKTAPGEQTRANGNVVKAVATALQAKTADGRSAYAQGVEMLGFAAAVAPLLQGDRLARLIAEAPKVATAYAPDRFTMRFYAAASAILERYPEQRRETLLVSLWHAVHAGRFWDITSGVTELTAPRHRQDAVQREARAAADALVEEILDGVDRDTDEAHAVIAAALLEERLPFNEVTSGLVANLPETIELRDSLARAATRMRVGDPVYPDQAVLISHIGWARPDERPESPIAWVMMQLSSAIKPDPVTGAEPLLRSLPAKPKTWRELFPSDVVTGFPHPPAARRLDGRELPGAVGVMVEVVKNSAELAENRDYMGNCTWSYKSSMEQGAYVLFKLFYNGERYNASVCSYRGGPWVVGEVNSRHNGGNVPQFIRDAVAAVAAQLPPRVAPDGPGLEARSRQFRMVN